MRIAISGSTGFIGKRLSKSFIENNWEVLPITRQDISLSAKELSRKIENVDIIINLAGAPIAARWTDEYKKTIVSSRIFTTQKIVSAINLLKDKPKLFISTSAIGIYNNVDIHTENSLKFENDFLSNLCQDWEMEANKAEITTVILRFSVVLDNNEGALPKMLLPFKLGVGGKIGNGTQHFSWISIDDLISAFFFIINKENITGVFNLAAPEPTNNIELTKEIAKALKRPSFFTVPLFALKLLYGEGANIIANGQAVLPEKLLQNGFVFKYPTLKSFFTK